MRKCQLCAYVLLVLTSQSYTISDFAIRGGETVKKSCSDNEYWNEKGFCCDRCHPGFKLKEKCPEQNKRSKCETCEAGTYLDKSNYNENCFRCKECNKPHSKEISPCTFKSDRVCGCNRGYYYKKLGDLTWECKECKNCGHGQQKTVECTGEQNTQCRCKDNHYPVKGKNVCEPCVKCQEECQHLCISSTPRNPVKSASPTSPPGTLPQILVPVCACITVIALGVFMLYEGIRLWKKKRQALSSQKSSPASEDQTLIITVQPDTIHESVPFTNQPCETEQNGKLPDCVPREIKIHEFFYFVLDEVPIGRFKELVRRLGVSEQNIDRAEQDHRNCKDAHYQMLKVWSDSGSGGGSNVLPCHCVQMFVDTLKDMCLVNCADNIENRFLSQDTSASH
ncbi:tumor necrosis factor receptor superfamily member 1A [Sinocyclocheilus rhinocerous]|uniref:Tumor necrosis factor receptor superfamily member 1A-like n=1 Tax=Sinocyclocheilus rhinocerous TaxID=307959 RepID=A0A673FPB6_9TELE|nr:PREDICTED: tumor necrosis factor receptor superfamily member 1A-like [Sinocyclocheilus rhinocerous]XP_016413978.1 PREDICTED: tumor necrosis factor receptor superfamily member 1A-like [Sinocyclocheilus rhinocerous]